MAKLKHKKATTIRKADGLVVRLYDTDIVKILPNGDIQLNSGGFMTATTKRRMNEAAKEFELYFNVFQKKKKWYVSTEDRLEPPKTVEFFDGIVIPGPQHLKANPKRRKKVTRKKRRSAAQIAATKKLVAWGKKHRGRKKRKTTVRKKRRNPVRKTRKTSVRKKSARSGLASLWFVFACKGKEVKFLKSPAESTHTSHWAGKKTRAQLFRSKSFAQTSARRYGHKAWQIGAASYDTTTAQIRAACSKK